MSGETGPQADVQLDLRGLLCPRPIIDLAACLRDLPVGAVVTLRCDDAAIVHDLPAWCAGVGHVLLDLQSHGRDLTARVRKAHARF
jgi:TusA-related sulfurtransferase